MKTKKINCQNALLSPLWESAAHNPSPAPRKGHRWLWQDVRKYMHEAAQLTSPEVVERRVLRLVNPDQSGETDESTVGNLAAAVQLLLPGEKARVHRHSINALRFVLEGEGATTLVNGKPVAMRPGDLLLTPGECWHEHFHDGDEPSIWLDVLDAPLHTNLGVITFEPGPVSDEDMPPSAPIQAFKSAGILPVGIEHQHDYSPVFSYPYQDVLNALEHTPIGENGARAIRYTNPLTGGAAMSSIDLHMLELEAEQGTRDYSCNADFIFLVVDGEGETWINDQHYQWSKYDILTVPRNNWFRHLAHTKAHLFQVSDSEMLRRLDMFKESYRENET